jgi:hypothetical protein
VPEAATFLSGSIEAIRGPRLWRPPRRPTVPGPKVPMTRRRGAEAEIEALRAGGCKRISEYR